MKFNCIAKLLATENRVSTKTGTAYQVGLFQQGVSTITIMLPQNHINLLSDVSYRLDVDYNPQYQNIKLDLISDIEKVNK